MLITFKDGVANAMSDCGSLPQTPWRSKGDATTRPDHHPPLACYRRQSPVVILKVVFAGAGVSTNRKEPAMKFLLSSVALMVLPSVIPRKCVADERPALAPKFDPDIGSGIARGDGTIVRVLVDKSRSPFVPGKAKSPDLAVAIKRLAANALPILSDDSEWLRRNLDGVTWGDKPVWQFYHMAVYPRKDLVVAGDALARSRTATFTHGELKTL